MEKIRSIISRHTVFEGNMQRTTIKIFGIAVYVTTTIDQRPRKPKRPTGFIQFPNDAPGFIDDDDYFEDEED